MSTSFSRLWAYRGFIVSSVKREFQLRYKNSILGIAWVVLNPLSMILIYTLIFSQVMQARLPGIDKPFAYSIYLMAGLLPWGFFAEILNRSQSQFLDNANLIKKVNFPKFCLPIIISLSSLLNFFIVFSLFILFLIMSNQFPGWVIFNIFPILLLQIFLALSLGLILGVLNVFFRDVGQAFGIFLQFWFWLTPIIYVPELIPQKFQFILYLNPMSPIIAAYQDIFVSGRMPDWSALLTPLCVTVVLGLLAYRLYQLRSSEMVDEL